MSPISNFERIQHIFYFLTGTVFVAYILHTWDEINRDYEVIERFRSQALEVQADEISLQSWLVLLTRYRDNKPFPSGLEEQLYSHFRYFWTHNRVPGINQAYYMDCIPKTTRRAIIVNYIFDDFLHAYRHFLRP